MTRIGTAALARNRLTHDGFTNIEVISTYYIENTTNVIYYLLSRYILKYSDIFSTIVYTTSTLYPLDQNIAKHSYAKYVHFVPITLFSFIALTLWVIYSTFQK